MLPDIQPGNTKILYFFNCLLDGMHTKMSNIVTIGYGDNVVETETEDGVKIISF